jgi:hypothetical protein
MPPKPSALARCPAAIAEPLEPGTGEPSGAEILTAISEWLASDIKPLVSGPGQI